MHKPLIFGLLLFIRVWSGKMSVVGFTECLTRSPSASPRDRLMASPTSLPSAKGMGNRLKPPRNGAMRTCPPAASMRCDVVPKDHQVCAVWFDRRFGESP